MPPRVIVALLVLFGASACDAKEQGPCDGTSVYQSQECSTYASDFCRALTTQGDCQAKDDIDAGGAFCQWTRVATLVDEDSCTFAEPFGRCEAAACPGFCDGVIADTCGPDGSFLENSGHVFVDAREFVDVIGSGSGQIGSIIGPWASGETASCDDGALPAGPSWCSCGQQACESLAGTP